MDRAEQTGLGVAVVAHAMLFAALSLNLLKPPELPKYDAEPIEVSLVDTVALESTAPQPSPAPAPATASTETAPTTSPEELAPAPLPTIAQSKPAPKPVAKLAPTKPTPNGPQPRRKPGLSRDILVGIGDSPAKATPTTSSANSNAESVLVKRSLSQEIGRQLKPKWKSPTGADVDRLVTVLSWDLAKDGSLIGEPRFVDQTGVTPSNGPQAKLHRENAVKAVRAAAPFTLPSEYYGYWKSVVSFRFDKRLSQ